MILLVDDVRNLPADMIARTAEAGKIIYEFCHVHITHVLMDHDLGVQCTDETGYDVLEYMLDIYPPSNVTLVTANPAGRANMQELLYRHGYRSPDAINFFRFTPDEKE